jgi:NAD(P)-dependent dehydrogenase (short-subunit alcohol dehydrogenase family)
MLKFKDKTVLITGGGSGIGEAMAYQHAKKGANVILTGRRIETLERVKSKCEEYIERLKNEDSFEYSLESNWKLIVLPTFDGNEPTNVTICFTTPQVSLQLCAQFLVTKNLLKLQKTS